MTEQLQRHVWYHLKIGSRHQKVKFSGIHYQGFDENCRKGLNVCDYNEDIQINIDDYFRFHHRHSLESQRYFFKTHVLQEAMIRTHSNICLCFAVVVSSPRLAFSIIKLTFSFFKWFQIHTYWFCYLNRNTVLSVYYNIF